MYLHTSVDHSKYINTSLVREWAVETVPRIDGPNDLTESYAIVAVYSESHARTVADFDDRAEADKALQLLIFIVAGTFPAYDNRPIYYDAKTKMWQTM